MTSPAEIHAAEAPLAPLFASLAKAHAEMGGRVTKDRQNPHFRSSYATLAAVLEVATPALSAHGLVLVQYREGSDLVTRLAHESGAELRTSYPLRPRQDTEQGWGSAITYARRYQAMALLGLAPADDDDGHAASQGSQDGRNRPPPRDSRRGSDRGQREQRGRADAKPAPEAASSPQTDPAIALGWARLVRLYDGAKDAAKVAWRALQDDAELGDAAALHARLDAYTACRSYLTVLQGRGSSAAAIVKQVHEDTTKGWRERAGRLAQHVGEFHPAEVGALVLEERPPAAGGTNHTIIVGPGVPLTEEDIVRSYAPTPPGGALADHYTDERGCEIYVVDVYGSD